MNESVNILTPQNFKMLREIEKTASFAKAAKNLDLVPSTLTYRVRQIEDALDILLFDRSGKKISPTAAGKELLAQAARVENDLQALVERLKRIATGWEQQLTIAVDGIINHPVFMELVADFLKLNAPTQLRIRDEILSGTLSALKSGQADLAIGVTYDGQHHANIQIHPLGEVNFIYAVAPTHPLANLPEPLTDIDILKHRAIVVADSANSTKDKAMSFAVLAGQATLTVPSVWAKIDAQIKALGCGFVPEHMTREFIKNGKLIKKQIARSSQTKATLGYAFSSSANTSQNSGRALAWWIEKLKNEHTQKALIGVI